MSGCFVLPWSKPADRTGLWLSRVWAAVCCGTLLCFMLTDGTCFWLFRKWAAVVSHCVSCSLITWFLGLQLVSGCLLCFRTDDACSAPFREWVPAVICGASSPLMMPVLACPWLFSMWVAAVPCLLIMRTLSSPVCEWLHYLSVFQACWWLLALAFQEVRSFCSAIQSY